MQSLIIPETKETPEINFIIETGIFSITGTSLLESPLAFYNSILDWLSAYMDNPLPLTTVDFRFKYFNTSSAKQIVKLLFVLECIANNNKIIVNWYYKKADSSMLTFGTDYAKILKLNFNLIEY